jgi:GxxExxY protein
MKLIHEALTYQLRGIFYQTYNALGPGFDENLYQEICFEKCINAGIEAKKEQDVHVIYKDHKIATLFLDLLARKDLNACHRVDDKVIVEFKAVDAIAPVHKAQLICYLQTTAMTIGLLANFSLGGVEIERLANFPKPVEKVRLQDYCCKDSFSLTDYRDEVVIQVVRGICEVWNELSYGYLESVYLRALELELGVEPFFFDQDLEFDVCFESKRIGTQKIKSVLNDDIWVVLTSTTKPRKGMENKIRSILKSTSLSCGILANLNGNRPQIKIIQPEKVEVASEAKQSNPLA